MARNAQEQAAFEAEEKRLAAQTPFDPKVHGVGTAPSVHPESVAELHKWVTNELMKLHRRVDMIFGTAQAKVPPKPNPKEDEEPKKDPEEPIQ